MILGIINISRHCAEANLQGSGNNQDEFLLQGKINQLDKLLYEALLKDNDLFETTATKGK